ncbi:hypothetical protein PRZ48_008699 [Zasmidium cellare]|uniref:Uncharacterized protein n=1 Tax=Zasmidium cellare TaxID=395010 RepID=A0ABR0EG96_ZASCE|nr:hypothetical protein PRZ48_008699 [Zasmidium cellare]
MSPQNGIDLEEDELMQHLLKRKRRLEELEDHNKPEVLLLKKRAVREEAERRPALRTSNELDFDDDIEASANAEQDEATQAKREEEEMAERWARKSKRGRRRARCAMRKRALKAQQDHPQEQPLVQAAR